MQCQLAPIHWATYPVVGASCFLAFSFLVKIIRFHLSKKFYHFNENYDSQEQVCKKNGLLAPVSPNASYLKCKMKSLEAIFEIKE
jgi:hypothetical protein